MAAYAALVSLMHIIDDIENHPSPPISLNKPQVQSLTEIVTFLQDFLEGYSSPVADGDEADPLEMRIADAAYAAEDVIESCVVEKIQPSRSKEGKINRYLNCFRGPKNLKNLYQDLQQVLEEMDLIKKELMDNDAEKAAVDDQRHRFVSASVDSVRSSSSSSYPSSSTGQNSSMVCSDDVVVGIMEKLAEGRLVRQVIPIEGMGGIGKTTLANNIYAQPHIKDRFDIRAWATISQHYNTREILCELLSQTTNRKKEELSERSEDRLGLELYKYLFGRRYLIVMDDMWSIDAWDKIQRYFPNNENGSRILVTTRLSQLSSQLNNNYSLQMQFLDEASSWNLFSKTVFGEKSCPSELETTGRKIVENCRGLPLSIVVVGGLLKKMEHNKRSWESIRKNLASSVNLENDKHCLRLLKMSYNHLPVYLKPCFLYMGVFEEDDVVRVSTLIKLWVSEGFLKPVEGKSLETIAHGFLKDLVDRNLILIHHLGKTGRINSCKIHDLLRDLCLNEGKKDGFYHVIGQCCPRGINRQRRVVIPRNTSKRKVLHDLQSMSHTRSIICENGKVPRCQNFGLLRTFHAYKFRTIDDKSYRNSHVYEYFNLRHLAVEVGSMPSFFSSANLLWNLQTLIISYSHNFIAILCILLFRLKVTAPPIEIWKMLQLRHIDVVEERICLPDPPSDGVIMENLQTLKGIENFKCSDEVVRRIPNLKKLSTCYRGPDEGTGHDDYFCLSNIKRLCKLESLDITCFNLGWDGSFHELTFPHSLKSLSLDIPIEWEGALEEIGWLPLLEKLRLYYGRFGTGTWETTEGQFPSLKYLELSGCFGLRRLTVQESSIFPRLEQLHLRRLRGLKDIASEIGDIPTLKIINLVWCSESAVMCAKEIVDEQVELQGEHLPFHVVVLLEDKNEELQSLAGPNFQVYA